MTASRLNVVEVRRVSTDDKGQDPARQGELNESWAHEHGVEIVGTVTDEGTSAWKKGLDNPYERDSVKEAVTMAQDRGALGLLFETPDRFTRAGPKIMAWAEIELERQHGLKVYYADQGAPDAQGGFMGELTQTVKGSLARQESEQKSRRNTEAAVRAKANGTKLGRKPKALTNEQVVVVIAKHQEGWGYRKIAHHINKLNGVYEIADPSVQKKRSISKSHIERLIKREKTKATVPKLRPSQKSGGPQ